MSLLHHISNRITSLLKVLQRFPITFRINCRSYTVASRNPPDSPPQPSPLWSYSLSLCLSYTPWCSTNILQSPIWVPYHSSSSDYSTIAWSLNDLLSCFLQATLKMSPSLITLKKIKTYIHPSTPSHSQPTFPCFTLYHTPPHKLTSAITWLLIYHLLTSLFSIQNVSSSISWILHCSLQYSNHLECCMPHNV
jgi:hypothetical protein